MNPVETIALPLVMLVLTIWIVRSDLLVRRIPNVAVLALFVTWGVIAVLRADPLIAFIQFSIGAVLFLTGWGLFALGRMGGGDVKLIGVGALFVHPMEWDIAALCLAATTAASLVILIAHGAWQQFRSADRPKPDWLTGPLHDFPFGVPLGLTLALIVIVFPDSLYNLTAQYTL